MQEAAPIFDWSLVLGQGGSVIITILVLWFYRKDRQTEKQAERVDRKDDRDAFKQAISEVTDAFKATNEKIIDKAEQAERLCEQRYQMLLEDTLRMKGNN